MEKRCTQYCVCILCTYASRCPASSMGGPRGGLCLAPKVMKYGKVQYVDISIREQSLFWLF